MKNLAKYLLLLVVTTSIFVLISAIAPYSQAFKEAQNSASNPTDILYLLLNNAWICFTVCFIIRKSPLSNTKTALRLSCSLFFIYVFMTQVETYFFGAAFPLLTTWDIVLIMLCNGFFVVSCVFLAVRLFGKAKHETAPQHHHRFLLTDLMLKTFVLGCVYMIIYFVFGYFVAWQVEDLRLFYSGETDLDGFIEKLISNVQETPFIYPFQLIRGMLFGLFILPIVGMFSTKPRTMLASIIFIYESTAICLIIPNILFPDSVRWAHFLEMASSMLLFAVMTWVIYKKLKTRNEDNMRLNKA